MAALLRATLLLIVLPALLLAAPAPLPRERKSKEAGGWSKPVDGLRVRLVAPQTRYRVGDTVQLFLEIQNVSGGVLMIEEPDLCHRISERPVHGWAITCKRQGRGDLRKELEELRRRSALRRLGAGATLRIEIAVRGGGERKEQEKEQLQDDEEPRKQDLYFPDGDSSGSYEFRVTFSRGRERFERGFDSVWNPESLTSPPVRIELEE